MEGWVGNSFSSDLDEFESGVARADDNRPIPQLRFPLYYLEVTESKITTSESMIGSVSVVRIDVYSL